MPSYLYNDPRAVFVRVPKTASTSITRSLWDRKPIAGVFGSIPGAWLGMKSFAFVRHPVDRVLSVIRMFSVHKTARTPHEILFRQTISIESVCRIVANDAIPPSKANYLDLLKLHALPATHAHFGLDRVDKVYRFEDLSGAWLDLCDWLEVPRRPLQHLKTYENGLTVTPSIEELELIHATYCSDFEAFGYDLRR